MAKSYEKQYPILRCQTCLHHERRSSECRRNPPVAMRLDGRMVSVWPKVRPSDFCGEFRPDQLATKGST